MPGDRRPGACRRAAPRGSLGGDSPEEIAEVLGLPIARVQQLLHDLDQGGEEIEREFVVWVDHARRRCLPYDALSGVAVKRSRSQPLSLRADPPTPAMLESMGLEAGLSWDLGIEGHVQVLDVLDVVVDIRDRSLPHELRLPDTQLLITEAGENETAEGTSVPLASLSPNTARTTLPHPLGARALRQGHLATSSPKPTSVPTEHHPSRSRNSPPTRGISNRPTQGCCAGT